MKVGAGGRGLRRSVAASCCGFQGRVSKPSLTAQQCSGFAGQVGFEASCLWWHLCSGKAAAGSLPAPARVPKEPPPSQAGAFGASHHLPRHHGVSPPWGVALRPRPGQPRTTFATGRSGSTAPSSSRPAMEGNRFTSSPRSTRDRFLRHPLASPGALPPKSP